MLQICYTSKTRDSHIAPSTFIDIMAFVADAFESVVDAVVDVVETVVDSVTYLVTGNYEGDN
jgi:hypothetical protein